MKIIKSIGISHELIQHEQLLTEPERLNLSKRLDEIGSSRLRNDIRRAIRPNMAHSQGLEIKDIKFHEIKIIFNYLK